ncbi:MAG: hypothetical protein GY822_16475 [Deltaproteobacteria bacterium]|nr:hypothetical protein [Deltaproteobacteria bacterium]
MSLSSGIQAVGASQRMRRNLLRRQFLEEWNKSKSRVVAIGLGGSFIFGGLFIAALFVGHFLASAGFSRIYPSFFMLLLLGSGGGLFISSMGQAANSFFAADDAWFWDAAPAPLWARFIDSLMRTGRTALPSMLAMTGAMGVGLFAGAGFDVVMLLRIATALFLHAVFILLLAVGCVQLLAALLPAGQIRRLSLVGLGGLLVAALMAVRSSGLFIGLSGKVSAETLDHFSAMSNVGPSWFWTQGLLRFAIEGRVTSFFLLWIFGLSIFSYFCFHFFYSVARDKAADAGEKSAQAGIAFFFMRQVTTLISAGTSKKMRALIQKDVRVFFRDPAQWSHRRCSSESASSTASTSTC